MVTKRAVCTVCDIACQLHVDVEDGRVLRDETESENLHTAGSNCGWTQSVP